MKTPVFIAYFLCTIILFVSSCLMSGTNRHETVRTSVLTKINGFDPPMISGKHIYFSRDKFVPDDSCRYAKDLVRVDMETHETRIQSVCIPAGLKFLGYDSGFFYFSEWRGSSVYRIAESGNDIFETVVRFHDNPFQVKVRGNEIFAVVSSPPGFFKYDLSAQSMVKLSDGYVSWFDFNEENIYVCTTPDLSSDRYSLAQISRSTGQLIERIPGLIWPHVELSGDYLYCSDSSHTLMRLPANGLELPLIVSKIHVPVDGGDCANIVVNDIVYYATSYGNLWKQVPGCDTLELMDTWGPFDDDDYTPWIGSDGKALFWIAGPDRNVRISDGKDGVLLKTMIED